MIDEQSSQTDRQQAAPRSRPPAQDQALPAVRAHTQHPAYRMARRFARHRIGMVGLVVLGILVLLALFAPLLSPYHQNATNLRLINAPPSPQHLLGTDDLGRDVWTRMLYGARVSMLVGIVAVGIYTLIGTALGSIAGYFGGTLDNLIMRFTEVVMCFPSFMLIMTMVVVLKPSLLNVMIIIGVFGWTGLARLVRGQVLSIRERDYVLAARAIGARQGRILVRHILPSTIAPILVSATLGLSGAVLTESGLSFLGIGVQAPDASWGSMLNTAMQLSVLQGKPWRWLPPAVAIALMVLAVNFIGDALRDALDPQMTD